MRNKACVINFEHNAVWVSPLINDACINCNRPGCTKRGTPFLAANPKDLKLKCGDIVKLEVSAKAQFVQAAIALFFPILAAVGGYFLANPLAEVFKIPASEGIKAACVLICLGLTTTIITILTRSKLNLSKPIIDSVL